MALGLKIRHYSNSFVNDNPHHVMTVDFGTDSVDRSFFRPDISATRSFAASGAQNMQMFYDFPDGKDTGQTIQTILRGKNLDLTEIDRIESILKQQVEAGKNAEAQEAMEQLQKLEGKDLLKYVKNLSDAITGADPKTTEVTTPTT